LGFDLDPTALAIARERLAGGRARLFHASYEAIPAILAAQGLGPLQGILLDLGVSSMQFDQAARGFAFRLEAPLDMRFDPTGPGPTAADIVNTYTAEALAEIFYRYGEESQGRRYAAAILKARPIETTHQLAALIQAADPTPAYKRGKIHPATQVFQALRIAVNDELGVLERSLPALINCLAPGGRLAVISFHSLEDRIVKEALRLAATDCICPPRQPICTCGHQASLTLITRKPIVPTEAEIQHNPRARSAKLRVAEKRGGS
jgi:16S rRNA (cytosine1402-N4)-methyltransferase